mmetsp:Transcript_17138/g.33096  ORF Transcript_17138/g.33096 Transcript_17138/m.33096 type:complete len:85 (+) Transcript_17138:372-626(+)
MQSSNPEGKHNIEKWDMGFTNFSLLFIQGMHTCAACMEHLLRNDLRMKPVSNKFRFLVLKDEARQLCTLCRTFIYSEYVPYGFP